MILRICHRCYLKKDLVNFNIVSNIEIGKASGYCDKCLQELADIREEDSKKRENFWWRRLWRFLINFFKRSK